MRGKISQEVPASDFFMWFAIFTTIMSLTIAISSSLKVVEIYEKGGYR
jgi:hypothetical protein